MFGNEAIKGEGLIFGAGEQTFIDITADAGGAVTATNVEGVEAGKGALHAQV